MSVPRPGAPASSPARRTRRLARRCDDPLFVAAALICHLIGGAAPAAGQAVSLLGSDAAVQPSSSSPVRINQAFGSSGWSVGGSGNGPTTYTGNSLSIPGVNPARWFCYITVAANRGWSMRTRTADFAAPNCPTNGLGSVSTTGLVAVIVEDGPPASVVARFAMNSGFWSSSSGYTRSSTQTALTTSEGTAIHARTADRVLVVHTGASGGTLCVTGTESGCSGALTWIPSAAAPTSVTTADATAAGFTVGWSGGWTGSADATVYVFASEVASGLTVDVSSGGMENGGPSSHAVTGRNAATRHVVTVCTQSGGMSCYDASADAGIQGVEVTTLAAAAPPSDPSDPTPTGGVPSRVEGVTTEALNGGLRVRWSPAGGAVSQYRVDVLAPPASGGARGVTQDGWTLVGRVYTDADTHEAVLAGLTNGVEYRVTVTALGSGPGVEGPASEPAEATPSAAGGPADPDDPDDPDRVPALPFGGAAALAAVLAVLARRRRAAR